MTSYPRLATEMDAEAAYMRLEADQSGTLKSGGGGGTFDGMEARVAKLETSMEFIKRDVGELRSDVSTLKTDVARLDERVKMLPSKGFIVSASVTIIGLLTAVVVFADKLRALVGHS